MKSNKIFWLDDRINEPGTFEYNYLTYLRDDLKDLPVEINAFTNSEEFMYRFERDNSVIGVILDVEGYCKSDDRLTSSKAFYDVYQYILSKQKTVKVIVFSGEMDRVQNREGIGHICELNHWVQIRKSEDDSYGKLKSALSDIFGSSRFHKYPYIQGLVSMGYVSPVVANNLESLISSYEKWEYVKNVETSIRTIICKVVLENFCALFDSDLLEQVARFASTKRQKYVFSKSEPANVKELITKLTKRKKGEKGLLYDYDNPLVPFCCCPNEVKCTLDFIWMYSNVESHELKYSDEFLLFFSESDNRPIEMLYRALFVILEWFYKFVSGENGQNNIDLTINSFKEALEVPIS